MHFPEIPGYIIKSPLGRGNMATIYRAWQPSSKRTVALKVIGLGLNTDPALHERFMQEARAAQLIAHGGLLHVYDMGEYEGLHYLSMEYPAGGDLRAYIRRGLELSDAVRVIKEIAIALNYYAQGHVIHGDINPSSIFLREDSSAVIFCFGDCGQVDFDSKIAQMDSNMCDPRYMSPEQARSDLVDGRSDLYSLGIIFFEILAGYVPYNSDSADDHFLPDADEAIEIGLKHISEPIPRLPPEMAAFQPFIELALAKKPELRFQSGMEMIDALEKLEEEQYDLIYRRAATTLFPLSADGTRNAAIPTSFIAGRPVEPQHSSDLVLEVTQSPDPGLLGQTFACLEFPFTIGRSETAGLSLTGDDTISRRHAEILITENGFLLHDLGTNGTIVNGQMLKGEFSSLSFGSEIRLSDGTSLIARQHRDHEGLSPEGQTPNENPISVKRKSAHSKLHRVREPRVQIDNLVDPPPTPHIDENVQFTAYCPRQVRPETYTTVLAFAHLEQLPPDAPMDTPHPVEEVKRQARNVLGDEVETYRSSTQESLSAIPREGELIFVLELDGFRCNPARQTVFWEENVHRVEFRIKAAAALEGKTCRGQLRVFLGDILLAEVALRVLVTSTADAGQPSVTERLPLRRYRKIFASYCRRDLAIVEQFERYASGVGDKYLRDLVHLRAGEKWNEGLKRLIDEADVFQLFWSTNSMTSPFVREEWMYALSLDRTHFIRPLYWEEPFPEQLPDLPPQELRELHFNMLGRYVGSLPPDSDVPAKAPDADVLAKAPDADVLAKECYSEAYEIRSEIPKAGEQAQPLEHEKKNSRSPRGGNNNISTLPIYFIIFTLIVVAIALWL